MLKRFSVLFLTMALLLLPAPAAAVVQRPGVSAQSYALMDDTGAIVCGSGVDKRLPAASTTKIMTALVVLEKGDISRVVRVKKEHTLCEGSRIYLREGEQLSLLDLLYGLMLSSGNDAALAIAEAVSGSVSAFVAEMNAKAAALGMDNTAFVNPSGLPQDGGYSCARDLALLMAYAMKNETFAEITGTRETVRAGRTFVNHNRLISTCPGVDGGKTGYTKQAGRCLVTTAQKYGRRLYAVTLNAPDDWDDHEKLYDYGFSRYERRTVFAQGEYSVQLKVVGGVLASSPLYIAQNVTAYVTEEELKAAKTVVCIPRFEYAPVKADQKIGYVLLVTGDKELARADLFCARSVKYRTSKYPKSR